jgi:RND family efflux transporter MFP subunit
VAAQKSVVKSLQAALAEIDVNLDKAQLTAPFDGSITKRYMDPGGIANASVPVIRLVEQSRLEAWIGLPISVASHIEDSSDYQIKIAGKYYGGTVKAKLDEVDVQTRTRTVVFSLDQSASIHAITGELCEIEVAETVDTSGIWVPTSSLVKGFRGLWLVYAIEENESGQLISQKRDVEVVKTRSDRVLVRGTLNDGEQIVRDGVHRIANHQAVTIVDSIENIDSNIKSDTAR